MHDHQAGSDRPAGHTGNANPRRLVAGNTVFFPAATLYAIFVLPASVFAMLGFTVALPALASTTGHAHEMLFGFALAVVAGNQLGPMPLPRLALLAGLWVIARATFLVAPLFMGGRLIAPTVAGQFYRQGDKLQARVQPRIEGGLLAAMAIAAAASAFASQPPLVMLAAAASFVAGALSVVRLLRWRLWALRSRRDLLCLAAGYGWLALGLLLYGAALVAGRYQTAALHIITVGALGTLTLNVMVMTWTLKARQDPARARAPVWATLLIAAATLARVLASLGVYDAVVLLQFAALCWSGAFALLLMRLVRVRALRNQADR